MRLFKCDTQQVTFTIVDMPRNSWQVLPPKKWQVIITIATIALTAILWSLS